MSRQKGRRLSRVALERDVLRNPRPCPKCKGSGIAGPTLQLCSRCGGEGEVR